MGSLSTVQKVRRSERLKTADGPPQVTGRSTKNPKKLFNLLKIAKYFKKIKLLLEAYWDLYNLKKTLKSNLSVHISSRCENHNK